MSNRQMAKRRAPYFQTTFRGPVGTVSEGTWDGRWTRRAYVDLGPFRVRSVITDSQMGTALGEARDDPDSVIRLGHMLVGRWVLSVTSDGHTERQGLFMFLLCNLAVTFIIPIVFLILAVIISELTFSRHVVMWPLLIGAAIWAAQMVMNFKARFGSSHGGPPQT